MERRRAPTTYALQTLRAWKRSGLAIGATFLLLIVPAFYLLPGAPFWALGIALVAGLAASVVVFLRIRPEFSCPRCGRVLGDDAQHIDAADGETIRFVCEVCQIDWDSGTGVPKGV